MRALGAVMVAMPFLAIFIVIAVTSSVLTALGIFGVASVLMVLVVGGVELMSR